MVFSEMAADTALSIVNRSHDHLLRLIDYAGRGRVASDAVDIYRYAPTTVVADGKDCSFNRRIS